MPMKATCALEDAMFRCRSLLTLPIAALCLVVTAGAQTPAQTTATAPEPAMQLPPDQAAFNSANATVDRQQRAAALETFLHQYPNSRRADRARSVLLDLLLSQQPQDVPRVHAIAEARVKSADKDSRANEENGVAYALAEALPNGVDLKAAEIWARDSVKQTTFQKISSAAKASYASAKEPAPSDKTLHEIYATEQAANLQTLADVYFHEGKLAEATSTIDQAQALNPTQGANYVTRGQVEHAQNHDDQALDALETAEVYGGMTRPAQDLMSSLYAAQHGGNGGGLDAEIDRRYRALYQSAVPTAHTPSTAGRTVLLALYTGSGCDPCTAADLAVDAILANYPRTEVVALAFDQHIPEPDPLANPATVARATYDGVRFTPTLRISGEEAPQIGGRRPETEKSYKTLAAAIDRKLSVPTGVSLHLTATLTPAHTVAASAHFQVTDGAALHKLLSSKPENKPEAGKAAAPSGETSAKNPKLVLNFALVQQEVRYSGENGIRFHPMVVRDLARPTADAFPVALSGTSSASASFDPAIVSANLSKYLADFAQHNDRFGSPRFLSTDTSLPLNQLAIAAWVEDLTSREVVAAAYTPLAGSSPAAPSTEQASR